MMGNGGNILTLCKSKETLIHLVHWYTKSVNIIFIDKCHHKKRFQLTIKLKNLIHIIFLQSYINIVPI